MQIRLKIQTIALRLSVSHYTAYVAGVKLLADLQNLQTKPRNVGRIQQACVSADELEQPKSHRLWVLSGDVCHE